MFLLTKNVWHFPKEYNSKLFNLTPLENLATNYWVGSVTGVGFSRIQAFQIAGTMLLNKNASYRQRHRYYGYLPCVYAHIYGFTGKGI